MSNGYTLTSFGSIAKVGRKTLYNWLAKYPEFAAAHEAGKAAALAFMEQLLMAKASGRRINGLDPMKMDTTAIIFKLKTNFHQDFGEEAKVDLTSDGKPLEFKFEVVSADNSAASTSASDDSK